MNALRRAILTIAAAALAALAGAAPAAAEWVQPPLPIDEAEDLSAPRSVFSAAGVGTVAWTVEKAGTEVLVYRRVGLDGALGPVVKLSDPAEGDASEPALAAAPGGEVIAAWTQGAFEAERVMTRRIRADGSLGPVAILSSPGGLAGLRLAVGISGFAYLAWMRLELGKNSIEGRAAFADGTFGVTRSFSSGAPSSYQPRPAVGSGQTALVTWTRSNPESQIQAKLVEGGGAPQSLLELDGGETGAGGQQVASRPDGSFLVAYGYAFGAPSFDSQVKARIVSAAGAVSGSLELSAAGQNADGAQLDVAPDGTATVAWRYRETAEDATAVQARRIGADGSLGTLHPTVSTGDGSIEQIEVGVDASGAAIIAWDQEDPLFEVVTRRLPASGDPEPAQQQVLAAPGEADPREALRPALSVDPAGRALLAYLLTGGGTPTDRIAAQRFDPPAAVAAGDDGKATRPWIARLRVTPKRARVNRRGKIRLRASEPMRVRFLVQRRLPHRKRFKKVKAFSRRVHGGGNALRFDRRIGKRKLIPGRYRLVAVGIDRDGERSVKRRAAFRAVR